MTLSTTFANISFTPPLAPNDTDVLIDRLNDLEPLREPFEEKRDVFEVWALAQDGERADGFALAVLLGQTRRAEEAVVRKAAHSRCVRDAALRRRAYQILRENVERLRDLKSWRSASELVTATHSKGEADTQLAALVQAIVRTTVDVTDAEFDEHTAQAIQALAPDVLREVLEKEELSIQPSTISLARVASSIPDKRRRPALFRILIKEQPRLWDQIWQTEVSNWSDDEWDLRLRVIAELDPETQVPALGTVCGMAPEAASSRIVQITALRSGQRAELMPHAVAKVRLRNQNADLEAAAIWWPVEEVHARLVGEILVDALPPDDHARVVVEAHANGLIDAPSAAFMVPGSMVQGILSIVEGQQSEQLARELAACYPDDSASALRVLQNESFSLHLAAASASTVPASAFTGASAAWTSLTTAERDLLLALLQEHATEDQRDLLDHVAGDTLQENAHRRAAAALRLAQLTPPGGNVPESILTMLQSGKPDLRTAAVQAISEITPADPDAVRAVRTIAVPDDEAGHAAQNALRLICGSFSAQIHDGLEKARRLGLLELLGATAQPSAVDELLRHLGPEAVDDDPSVRRAAARALREASDTCEFTPDQHRALGNLLDSPAPESDSEAKEDLANAFARVSLGSDAAIQTLWDFIGYLPKKEPTVLLGDEKDRLIRHLQLFATEATRGDAGRPHRIMQLDLVAERLVRAAYLRVGESESLKSEIGRSPTQPEYGQLIQALASVSDLALVSGDLRTLHRLRSEKTEYAHTGASPSDDDEATARTCFTAAAKSLIGVLEKTSS